ncbi:DNA packaging protein UL33 [Equid alphaherpesvirus 3]|uniref:DNA packaging protein UL33 n=1 Tax=Equid alphaherpesvirus 3 TaxID=80341 RepID=A0A077B7J8_9ALPH|nr:DNA packaging protein UL33 [Equid alphaherpesvirus 3]AIL02944.1 DNA packaging protein UL33 [Equid alphaherpesvirus 3]
MSKNLSDGAPRRLGDVIPARDLEALSLDALEAKYRPGDRDDVGVWFEDLMPPEMEMLMPTTDAKLNYLSFTRRLASSLLHAPNERQRRCGERRAPCEHAAALEARKERFAAIINKFLDLHQILHDA